jgi:hypothetical protein
MPPRQTTIVYIPNRLVESGEAGFPTFKGALNVQFPVVPEQELTHKGVRGIFENGAAQLPSKPGLPDFARCLACVYVAKGRGDDAFMATDEQCRDCFEAYCWRG